MLLNKLKFIADFETIDRDGKQAVWLWNTTHIKTLKHTYGYNIESFMDFINSIEFACDIYFHNLKFDGSYIMDFLIKNGYVLNDTRKTACIARGEFNTLITEFGQMFKITIRNKNNVFINFYDSLKLLPMSASKLAKDFQLEETKGTIDYYKKRPDGYIATEKELEYCQNDCIIIAKCMKTMLNFGFDKMTISSCAYNEFKKSISKQQYSEYFGEWERECTLELDKSIRAAYRGGFCLPNEDYIGKTIKQPVYYNDVNSLYPWVMRTCKLPYGMPVEFEGEYETDEKYPYYVQKIRVDMSVKKNGIPCILWQHATIIPGITITEANAKRQHSNYIYDTCDQAYGNMIELTVTNFDLDLIYKNYNIYGIEFLGGWKFMAKYDTFNSYIDRFYRMKEKATKDDNGAIRTIAKLFLNSLYGKFGQNPERRRKLPYYDESEKCVKYKKGELEIVKKFNYLPIAIFVTAQARYKVVTDILKIGKKNWIYTDTDSIVTLIPLPNDMKHETKLGKYKVEHIFKKFKVLSQKTYFGITLKNKNIVAIAGCKKEATKGLSFGKFNYGAIIKNGRSCLRTLDGGRAIVFGDFTLKDKRIKHIIRENETHVNLGTSIEKVEKSTKNYSKTIDF